MYKTKSIDGEELQYLHKGKGDKVVFLHSFGCPPHEYRLLDLLAEDHELIAPKMYSMNYLKKQPTTLKGYTDLTRKFIESFSWKEYHIVGHSTGGTVAYLLADEKAIDVAGLDPLMPVDYGLFQFALRGTLLGLREMSGIAAGWKSVKFTNKLALPLVVDLFRNLPATLKVTKDICRFNYSNLNVKKKAVLLMGAHDEYFKVTEKSKTQLKQSFKQIEIKILKGKNHDWPIFYPKMAKKELKQFWKK